MMIETFILVLIGLAAGGMAVFKTVQSTDSLSCCRTCGGQCSKGKREKGLR